MFPDEGFPCHEGVWDGVGGGEFKEPSVGCCVFEVQFGIEKVVAFRWFQMKAFYGRLEE